MSGDEHGGPARKPRSRREALALLGLGAGTAYVAPTLLSLTDADAHHAPGHDGGPPWGRPSRPTQPTRPGRGNGNNGYGNGGGDGVPGNSGKGDGDR